MNKFTLINEPMNGLKIIKINSFKDDRGIFSRYFCSNDFKELGLKKPIVNINHSNTVTAGTIRGLHFQYTPSTEIKIIKCIKGSIFDTVVDIRKESNTYLKSFSIELKEDDDILFYIPEGFAHGFQSLEDNTSIIYFVTSFYSAYNESGINPFDPILNINWPLPCTFISEKDKAHKLLDRLFEGI